MDWGNTEVREEREERNYSNSFRGFCHLKSSGMRKQAMEDGGEGFLLNFHIGVRLFFITGGNDTGEKEKQQSIWKDLKSDHLEPDSGSAFSRDRLSVRVGP